MKTQLPHAFGPDGVTDVGLVVFEQRIPGTRQGWKFLLVLVLVAVFAIGSGDPFVAGAVVFIGGWMLVHDLFSMFGWEHLILTESTLRLERRLFGRVLKRVDLARDRIESIDFIPQPKGLGRFAEGEDRDQDVWGFDSGPIVVGTDVAYFRLGQGYIRDRGAAKDVVDRLLIFLPLPVHEDPGVAG